MCKTPCRRKVIVCVSLKETMTAHRALCTTRTGFPVSAPTVDTTWRHLSVIVLLFFVSSPFATSRTITVPGVKTTALPSAHSTTDPATCRLLQPADFDFSVWPPSLLPGQSGNWYQTDQNVTLTCQLNKSDMRVGHPQPYVMVMSCGSCGGWLVSEAGRGTASLTLSGQAVGTSFHQVFGCQFTCFTCSQAPSPYDFQPPAKVCMQLGTFKTVFFKDTPKPEAFRCESRNWNGLNCTLTFSSSLPVNCTLSLSYTCNPFLGQCLDSPPIKLVPEDTDQSSASGLAHTYQVHYSLSPDWFEMGRVYSWSFVIRTKIGNVTANYSVQASALISRFDPVIQLNVSADVSNATVLHVMWAYPGAAEGLEHQLECRLNVESAVSWMEFQKWVPLSGAQCDERRATVSGLHPAVEYRVHLTYRHSQSRYWSQQATQSATTSQAVPSEAPEVTTGGFFITDSSCGSKSCVTVYYKGVPDRAQNGEITNYTLTLFPRPSSKALSPSALGAHTTPSAYGHSPGSVVSITVSSNSSEAAWACLSAVNSAGFSPLSNCLAIPLLDQTAAPIGDGGRVTSSWRNTVSSLPPPQTLTSQQGAAPRSPEGVTVEYVSEQDVYVVRWTSDGSSLPEADNVTVFWCQGSTVRDTVHCESDMHWQHVGPETTSLVVNGSTGSAQGWQFGVASVQGVLSKGLVWTDCTFKDIGRARAAEVRGEVTETAITVTWSIQCAEPFLNARPLSYVITYHDVTSGAQHAGCTEDDSMQMSPDFTRQNNRIVLSNLTTGATYAVCVRTIFNGGRTKDSEMKMFTLKKAEEGDSMQMSPDFTRQNNRIVLSNLTTGATYAVCVRTIFNGGRTKDSEVKTFTLKKAEEGDGGKSLITVTIVIPVVVFVALVFLLLRTARNHYQNMLPKFSETSSPSVQIVPKVMGTEGNVSSWPVAISSGKGVEMSTKDRAKTAEVQTGHGAEIVDIPNGDRAKIAEMLTGNGADSADIVTDNGVEMTRILTNDRAEMKGEWPYFSDNTALAMVRIDSGIDSHGSGSDSSEDTAQQVEEYSTSEQLGVLPNLQQLGEYSTLEQMGQLSNCQQMDHLPSGLQIDQLPSGQQIDQLPSGQQIDQLPSGQQIDQLPRGQQIDQLPSGQQIDQLPSGQQIDQLPSGQQIDQLPNGQQIDQLPSGKQMDQLPSGQQMGEYSTFEQMCQLSNGQQMGQLSSGQQMDHLPSGQQMNQLPSGQQMGEYSTLEQMGRLSSGQQMGQLSSGQQMDHLPSGQQMGEYSTFEQMCQLSNGQQMGQLSSGQQMDQLCKVQQMDQLSGGQHMGEYSTFEHIDQLPKGQQLDPLSGGQQMSEYSIFEQVCQLSSGQQMGQLSSGQQMDQLSSGQQMGQLSCGQMAGSEQGRMESCLDEDQPKHEAAIFFSHVSVEVVKGMTFSALFGDGPLLLGAEGGEERTMQSSAVPYTGCSPSAALDSIPVGSENSTASNSTSVGSESSTASNSTSVGSENSTASNSTSVGSGNSVASDSTCVESRNSSLVPSYVCATSLRPAA